MKKETILGLLLLALLLQSLIVRHDVPDQEFIDLAKQYPQICHLSDGEGTLISPSMILTAAHVATVLLEEMEQGMIPEITIGKYQFPVEKVWLHPKFELTKTAIQHDIALIKIKKPVKDIGPAKLYEGEEEMEKIITIVGRGDKGTGLTGPKHFDKINRAATNKIDGLNEHWIQFKFDAPESENTTPMEGVSGPGDSGGPAFLDIGSDRYVIGVSSHQIGNGQQGLYGVTENYARVSFYKAWIEEMLKEHDAGFQNKGE